MGCCFGSWKVGQGQWSLRWEGAFWFCFGQRIDASCGRSLAGEALFGAASVGYVDARRSRFGRSAFFVKKAPLLFKEGWLAKRDGVVVFLSQSAF